MVDWIIQLSRCGFPVSKDQLFAGVQVIGKKRKLKTPFLEGRPSETWYNSFPRRHQELCDKMSQNLILRRALASEESIRDWFRTIETYLSEKNLINIDPSRCYNLDESGFLLAPSNNRVLVHKRGEGG